MCGVFIMYALMYGCMYVCICYAQTWNLLNPRIALLIPRIPGLADNPRIEHAQTWNLLNPRIVLLVPKIP